MFKDIKYFWTLSHLMDIEKITDEERCEKIDGFFARRFNVVNGEFSSKKDHIKGKLFVLMIMITKPGATVWRLYKVVEYALNHQKKDGSVQ